MPEEKNSTDELDLHWTDEDPDFGIASEGVNCRDVGEISSRIEKVKSTVKIINLHNQHSLTKIPEVLKDCPLLEELNISHTGLKEMPDFLFDLPNLRVLSCCCRELLQPPENFANAKKLEKLHMRVNEKWNFPKGITALNELKSLSIDFYSTVTTLPDDLGTLKKLEELVLALKYEDGNIRCLPASFEKHSVLKRVTIGSNIYKKHKVYDLDKTAKILASCPAMESLKFAGLDIGKGHKNLSSLSGLKELELRNLAADDNILDSINGLRGLEKLDIWGNELKIKKLPDIFKNFSELQVFSFSGNFVNELPPSLYTLSKLSTLEIGNTGISAVDPKIGEMQNLEKIHLFDNMLETLPETVFSLPRLSVLNIEDNNFKSGEIEAIRKKIADLNKNGRKIELMDEGQGRRYMVKKLHALEDINAMDPDTYYKHCLNAVIEDSNSIKYANKEKLKGYLYAALCLAAVKRNCFSLEIIDIKMLSAAAYFSICMETAKSSGIGQAFKLIKDDLLSTEEYIQVCLESSLHNTSADFLNQINKNRLNNDVYDKICWAAVLHYPPVISKLSKPSQELKTLAAEIMEKHAQNKKNAVSAS